MSNNSEDVGPRPDRIKEKMGHSPEQEEPIGSDQESSDDDSGSATREKKQMPVYLPPEQRDEVEAMYRRFNSLAGLSDDRIIEKHSDFFEAVFGFVIENKDEIAEELDMDPELLNLSIPDED